MVIHLSGSLGLDVLQPHPRRGSLHPLVPLPNAGHRCRAAPVGDHLCGGRRPGHRRRWPRPWGAGPWSVDDAHRAAYHAAASIAANHLVALIGQVERVAASVGLPLDAFAGLMRAATDDALALGPRRALTGPAARGDWDTVERHRAALSAMAGHRTELAAYDAMVGLARRLSLEPAPAGVDPSHDPSGPPAPEDGRPAGRLEAEQVA